MHTLIQALRHAHTLRNIRETLQSFGLQADIGTNSCVLCGAPEFVIAAAIARSQSGE